MLELIERLHQKKPCSVCGVEMQKSPKTSAAKWATQLFCSHACHNESRKGVAPEEAADALIRRTQGDEPDGCHNWTGPVQKDGYGTLTFAGKKLKAHRLAYITWVGEIGSGMSVCHRCDNRLCINPRHLFLGTNADNTADRNQKGRQAKGASSGRAKLTEADVLYIRSSSESYAALAARFNVGQTAISNIKARRSWSHV